MIESMIDSASTYSADIDNLIILIGLFVGFWFILAQVVFFGLMIKFRYREGKKAQYITGEKKHEMKWIHLPHNLVLICDVFIIVAAVRVWVDVKQTLPEPDRVVQVIAQQWAWTFVDPGEDRELGTKDDIRTVDEMHVQAGLVYHYKLTSLDVLHSFSVPAFRLKQDAIPGREITGWFEATKLGDYDIQCAEICGVGHGLMGAKVTIHSPEGYDSWVKDKSRSALALRN